MKKITLIISLFVLSYSFAQLPAGYDVKDFIVTSTPNKTYNSGDRFDFQFKIKGNYGSNEIRLEVYEGNYSNPSTTSNSNNLVSYSRWNREGDNNLNFPSFITKNWWSALGSNVGAFRISGAFTLKITYVKYISGSGNNYNYYSKVLHYTVPISDSDGDGVSDGYDDCPNQPGPASNRGCPLPAAKADLYIDEIASNIIGECGSTFPCNESYKNAKTHRYSLYNPEGNDLSLATVVFNKGNAASGNNKIYYYLSLDNKIDSYDFKSTIVSNLGPLSPNRGTTVNELMSIYEFRKNGNNPSASNYNLIIEIKVDDKDNSNNTFTIPVRVTAKSNSTISASPQNSNTSNNTESYKIDIYDFSGTFLKSVKMNASMNDKELMNGMPSGLFILKNSDGTTRKIVN
jgi:hypothetical protein